MTRRLPESYLRDLLAGIESAQDYVALSRALARLQKVAPLEEPWFGRMLQASARARAALRLTHSNSVCETRVMLRAQWAFMHAVDTATAGAATTTSPETLVVEAVLKDRTEATG